MFSFGERQLMMNLKSQSQRPAGLIGSHLTEAMVRRIRHGKLYNHMALRSAAFMLPDCGMAGFGIVFLEAGFG